MLDFSPLIRWIDVLTRLVERLLEARRGRRALIVRLEDSRCVVRAAAPAESEPLAEANMGDPLPEELRRRALGELVLLEWPLERTVIRKVSLPAQAREFVSGIVANRIDRLSPWPMAKSLYGFVAESGAPVGLIDIRLYVAARDEVERARALLEEAGLGVDRVVVTACGASGAAPVLLWSRGATRRGPDAHRLRLAIGGGLAAHAAASLVILLWTSISTMSLQSNNEELAARARALQKRTQSADSAQAIAALGPAARAWIGKERRISTVALLEALSRALPDGAHLAELHVEGDRMRIAGFADDAPPLVGALEASGIFVDVRFSAPTTRGPDGRLFRFGLEAKVAPPSIRQEH